MKKVFDHNFEKYKDSYYYPCKPQHSFINRWFNENFEMWLFVGIKINMIEFGPRIKFKYEN